MGGMDWWPQPGSEWIGRALFSCGEAASAKKDEGEAALEADADDTTGEEEVDEALSEAFSEPLWRKAGMGSEVGAGELWKVGPA